MGNSSVAMIVSGSYTFGTWMYIYVPERPDMLQGASQQSLPEREGSEHVRRRLHLPCQSRRGGCHHRPTRGLAAQLRLQGEDLPIVGTPQKGGGPEGVHHHCALREPGAGTTSKRRARTGRVV